MTQHISSNERRTSATSETQSLERPAGETQRSDFDAEFRELLDSGSSEGQAVFSFIRMRLKQFHLESAYSEACILGEVYLRAVRQIETGAEIRSPKAWVRSTAYNYIRELSRTRRRSVSLDENHLAEETHDLDRLELEEQLNVERIAIQSAFQQLNPGDRRLLQLKVIEGLSWRDIQGCGEYADCSETTLRKRKQRALEKLKQLIRFPETEST